MSVIRRMDYPFRRLCWNDKFQLVLVDSTNLGSADEKSSGFRESQDLDFEDSHRLKEILREMPDTGTDIKPKTKQAD